MALINQFNAHTAAYGAQYCAVIGSITLFAAMCFGSAARALAQYCAGFCHRSAVFPAGNRASWALVRGHRVAVIGPRSFLICSGPPDIGS